MLSFHRPVEAAFLAHAGLAAAGFAAGTRCLAPLLARVLRILGVDPDATSSCTSLPDTSSLSRAIGVAYVVEGSTLGGRFIRSRMTTSSTTSPSRSRSRSRSARRGRW